MDAVAVETPIPVKNFVNGNWAASSSSETLEVRDPSNGGLLGHVPVGNQADVDRAVEAAAKAYQQWRRTPPEDRIQYLFKLKQLLEAHFEELARLITTENGKTLAESRGELRRAIENVEVACGIPTLMQGYNLEDVAAGIDEMMVRQPIGVVAAITPFNFPAMIPFWFLPYAIACGNTFILKPSERVPLTMQRTFELMEELQLPPGVMTLLNGSHAVVDRLLEHPDVRAISFVGSTPVARYIYAQAAKHGKRVQCQGGAKNHVLVLPDADMDMTSRIVGESAFGCAGQRCLAVSVAITVDAAQKEFSDKITAIVDSMRVGNGLQNGVHMGPVITHESKRRIESLIKSASEEGSKPHRGKLDATLNGSFVAPTVLDEVRPESALADTEIFGPVLSVIHAKSIDEGIQILSRASFGNAASIFTSSGAAARKFRYEVPAGNVGVNIGVAAPMAYFPFSGWKESFFGVVHAQGRDAIEFYTEEGHRGEMAERVVTHVLTPTGGHMDPVIHKYNEYVITSFLKSVQPVVVERADGAVIRDRAGREYIDCFAGVSVVNAGHGNRQVLDAARAQMEKLVHCCSYMYYVEPVAQLAEKIAQIAPGKLKKTFFGNSGAEAVEGAVKLAKLFTGKSEIISLEASFHGRTWGTLSLTGNSGRKRRGGPYAPGVAFAPAPYFYRTVGRTPEEVGEQCAAALEQVIRLHTADNVAAFIAEPVMGEGGIIVPPSNYFKAAKKVLDKHNILFIADEVQTGFARTGKMFAIEHYEVEPDFLVTAKGIADGFPLSAFTTRDEIAAAFQPGDHLSTFGGNPVSCAAALANIKFMESERLAERSAELGTYGMAALSAGLKSVPLMGEIRGKGLMMGIELVKDGNKTPAPEVAEGIRSKCLEHGVLIGVGGIYGNVLRIQPPLTITKEQFDTALGILLKILPEARHASA